MTSSFNGLSASVRSVVSEKSVWMPFSSDEFAERDGGPARSVQRGDGGASLVRRSEAREVRTSRPLRSRCCS